MLGGRVSVGLMSVSWREEKASLVNSSPLWPTATPAHNSPSTAEGDDSTREATCDAPETKIDTAKPKTRLGGTRRGVERDGEGRGEEVAGENWRLARTRAKNDMIGHGPRGSRSL